MPSHKKTRRFCLILLVIVSMGFFFHYTGADPKATRDAPLCSNIEKEQVYLVESVLSRAGIPCQIKTKVNDTYDLFVKDSYEAYTLILLSQEITTPPLDLASGQINFDEIETQYLPDGISFDGRILNILIRDYCNKIKWCSISDDEQYEQLCATSKRALEYYIIKQLRDAIDVSKTKILIGTLDDTISFGIDFNVPEAINEYDVLTLTRILHDIDGTIEYQQKLQHNQMVIAGRFNWQLPAMPEEISLLERNSQKLESSVHSSAEPAQPVYAE